MIFAIADHIKQVIAGTKTQTRRASDRYQVGQLYAVQPCRTCKGIREGKIRIVDKVREIWPATIGHNDAQAEGEYMPEEFEKLYEKIHKNWMQRFAYTFRFVPSKRVVGGNQAK